MFRFNNSQLTFQTFQTKKHNNKSYCSKKVLGFGRILDIIEYHCICLFFTILNIKQLLIHLQAFILEKKSMLNSQCRTKMCVNIGVLLVKLMGLM